MPTLCRILDRHGVRASFFFSVGPDNMGRHARRLLRPAFLRKMLRSRAMALYGWDIPWRGTLWRGPVIGEKLGAWIRACAELGHEVGLHAWDHYGWQARIEHVDRLTVRSLLERGVRMLAAIGAPPTCSAVPAWRCTDAVLEEKAGFPEFTFNSDCRGSGVFRPIVNGRALLQPQVPVSLPTYDEVAGANGIDATNYNDVLLEQIEPGGYNVLCVHAEAEGISCAGLFDQFLARCRARGHRLVPLSSMVPGGEDLPLARLERRVVRGREGWVSCRA